MSAHVKRLALAMARKDDAEHARRYLRIGTFGDGRVLGECKSCPKYTLDNRYAESLAFFSSILTEHVDVVGEWWHAHKQTDMHGWYLSVKADAKDPRCDMRGAEEKLLDEIFGTTPKMSKPPFAFAKTLRKREFEPISRRSETRILWEAKT